MRRVHFIVAKAAYDAEIFSGHFGFVELVRGENGALTSQNEAPRKLGVEAVIPSAASRISSVFVDAFDVRQIGLFDRFCVRRIFYAVHVVDVARRVELRHKERVSVPEFGFDERAVELLKAERRKFVFDRFEKLHVGIRSAGDDACRRNRDVVRAESSAFPVARREQLRRHFSDFVSGDAGFFERFDDFFVCVGEFIRNRFAFDDFERTVRSTPLFCEARDDVLFFGGKRFSVDLSVFGSCGFF